MRAFGSTARLDRAIVRAIFPAIVLSLLAAPAHAGLIHYEFRGEVVVGQLASPGGATKRLSGRSFTATGMLTSDLDLRPLDLDVGLFAGTTTYVFDSLNGRDPPDTFITDPGADYLAQINLATFSEVGLRDLSMNAGILGIHNPPLFVDPNVPQVIGPVALNDGPDDPREQKNVRGETLTLGAVMVSGVVTRAKVVVHEPSSLAALLAGIAVLAATGFVRRAARRPAGA